MFKKVCLIIFVLFTGKMFSQPNEQNDHSLLFFGHAELSFFSPNAKVEESLPIRQNVSYQTVYYQKPQLTVSSSGISSSLKFEIFNPGYRIALQTGLKYIAYNTSVTGTMTDNTDYFFVRYSIENQEVKFARVKEIKENNHYLAIPIDLRYYFFSRKRYGFYVKVNTDIGLSISHELNILFHDPNMNTSKNEVLEVIKSDYDKFYTTITGAVGIRYNYIHKICLNGELIFPSTFMGNNYFMLTEANHVFGIRISAQMPINFNNNKKKNE